MTGPADITEKGHQETASSSPQPGDRTGSPRIAQPAIDRSESIAEVSHELRLPLANIRLLVETLLDGAVDDPEIARRMLRRAYKEVERLQALVVNLLSVEEVADKRQEVRCERVCLFERASYAAEIVSQLARSKLIKVEVLVPDDFTVTANPAQIDQVLLNLVENAVKFTPDGGTVRIKAGDRPGVFSVEDSGIGIPAQEIPKIFQRFYRIDRSKGSTGLGLSIVKHIADLHGARIDVKSREGKGSTFTIEFPDGRQAE